MRVLSSLALAASAVVLAGSMAQAASMSGTWSGPAVDTPASPTYSTFTLDLPAVGTTDWAFPYKRTIGGVQTQLEKTGGTAIGLITSSSGTKSNTNGNTGYENYGSARSRYNNLFGAPGTYTDDGTAPFISNSDGVGSRDFRDYAFDPSIASSNSAQFRSGRRPDEGNGGTDASFTVPVTLPAGQSVVRMYIGNSFNDGTNWNGGNNDGYNFTATLVGAPTYSATDWFHETREDGNFVAHRVGEVGYMEITVTPNNAGDLLTLVFSNTNAGFRRDVFMNAVTVSSAVPEPTSLGLLVLGGAALLRRRSR